MQVHDHRLDLADRGLAEPSGDEPPRRGAKYSGLYASLEAAWEQGEVQEQKQGQERSTASPLSPQGGASLMAQRLVSIAASPQRGAPRASPPSEEVTIPPFWEDQGNASPS